MKSMGRTAWEDAGERIRRARKLSGMTQVQLSEKMGVSTSELAKAECGRIGLSMDQLAVCGRLLGVDVDWLTTGAGDPPEDLENNGLSGVEIRRIRESLGLTREELAPRIGLKPSTLHNVELGHQRLGPAATATLMNQHSLNGLKGAGGEDDSGQRDLVRRAVKEAYAIFTNTQAMEALETLATGSVGVPRDDVVANLVIERLFDRE